MIKYLIILLFPVCALSQPVAHAGADRQVLVIGSASGNPNSQTLLDGSTSTGTGLTYAWTKISGPASAIDTIYKANTVKAPVARFNKTGAYSYKLTVTDASLNTSLDTVIITATSTPTLILPGAGVKTNAIACCEYSTNYLGNDNKIYQRAFNGSAKMYGMYGYLGTPVQIAGGQYWGNMRDDAGYAFILVHNTYFNQLKWLPVDTTGAIFDSITYVLAYISADYYLRNGKLYANGSDRHLWYGPLGTAISKPIAVPMPPGGRTYSKIEVGEAGVLGLATDSTVWKHGVGNKNPVQVTGFPRGVADILQIRKGTFVAIVPDAGQSNAYGWPYVWGLIRYAGGTAGGTSSTPTDYRAIWKIHNPIKVGSLFSSDESPSWIDTAGHAFSIGWNGQAEVGNGSEWVNRAELYSNANWYASDWLTGPFVDTAIDVTPAGHTIKNGFGGNAFGFYKYIIDERDSCWSWGRNKSFDGGNGKAMGDGGNARPNGLDILSPTAVSPLYAPVDQRAFVLGTVNAGANKSISTTSTSLTGTATATTFYSIAGYNWRQLSGPNTGVFGSATSATTTFTGLTTGTYNIELKMTDNNTATKTDSVLVIVNTSTPPTVTITPTYQVIRLPISSVSLNGSAVTSGGATVVSYAWSRRSGPTTFTFGTPGAQNTTVSFIEPGTYVFNLDVLDSNGNTGTQQATVVVLDYSRCRIPIGSKISIN